MPVSEKLRADRGVFTQPIMGGLFCSAVYILVTDNEQHRVSDTAGNIIAAVFVAGSLAFLIASCLKDWRTAFRIEFVALVAIILAFAALDLSSDVTLWDQLTFVGGLAFWVQVGSIRLAWHLWRRLRS